jgi:predicted RNA-binding protein associated with RNAse of E/G family
MPPITVHKCNHRGEVVWQYEAEVVERGATYVCLTAPFHRDDLDAGYVVFRRGDRFTEWFYSDRWYNVFRLEDVNDNSLKGWYCNIGRPARITSDVVAYDDLALDVFVSPRGEILVLDEDEFAALSLPEADARAARDAVDTIRALVARCAHPFNDIAPTG